ncbi:MAG: branched-chain amino acid ABC transporter permease [Solirubrobacteraceae bacterium]
MDLLQTSIISGVVSGMLYALAGVGLVVIYRVSGYISFAQGDIAAVALFLGWFLHDGGMPYLLVALTVVVCGAVLGGLIGGLLVVPMERFGLLAAAMATIAIGIGLQGIEGAAFGGEARAFPSAGEGTALTIGPVGLSWADVASFVVCGLIVAVLSAAFRFTRAGVAMRAVHDNPAAAEVLGIRANTLKRVAWIVSGALAGVVGLFIAPVYSLTPTSINALLVFGFAAIVVGGFDSIGGAVVSGIVIGIATNLTAAYVSSDLVTTSLFALLVVVLLFRPQGLFGQRPMVRV